MNALIAFATLAVADKISDDSSQIGPIVMTLSIVASAILIYIIAQKPNAYKEKEKQWDLGVADREKELEIINKKLSDKKFLVIVRTTDRKVSNKEADLIQILIDSGAKILYLTRDQGDQILYGGKDLNHSYPVITGVMKTDETTHGATRYILDLRIWSKETGEEPVFSKTVTIIEEKVEWLIFAFLRHVSSVCTD